MRLSVPSSRAVAVVSLVPLAALAALALLPRPGGGAAVPADAERVLANLLKLNGDAALVRYSAGALDRAAHVQARLESLAQDVRSWAGVDLGLRGLVLSPEDWAGLGLTMPYGMPQQAAAGIAVPAWGNDQSVAFWRGRVGAELPWGGGTPLLGTTEEAASLGLADTFLQVECGRLAAARVVTVRGEDWTLELLAHVVALSAISVHESERLPEIASTYALMAAHAGPPPRPEAFTAGGGFDTWMSFQPVFERGAEIVLAKDGRKGARTLLRIPAGNGGQLTRGDLLKRYPALAAWLRGEAAGQH